MFSIGAKDDLEKSALLHLHVENINSPLYDYEHQIHYLFLLVPVSNRQCRSSRLRGGSNTRNLEWLSAG